MKLGLGCGVLGVMLLAACGGTDSASDRSEGSCRGGAAHPVPAQRVVKAFRANGFAVRASVTDQDCARSIAYIVNNRGEKKDGTVSCWVSPHAIYKPVLDLNLHPPAYSPIAGGRKAELSISNVECVLHATDTNPEAQVKRFALAAHQIAFA